MPNSAFKRTGCARRSTMRSTDAPRRGKIKGDAKRGIDTNIIYKTDRFLAPIEQLKRSGEYKIKANQTVYLCFRSDFFIEEADQWREECWQMIKTRYHRIFGLTSEEEQKS